MTQSNREGPAPIIKVSAPACDGCRHLQTEWWKDYLDNDETDSGTSARCGAVPTEHGGKSITAYWSKGNAAPSWCPFPAHKAQSGNWQETLNDIARLEADNAALRAWALKAFTIVEWATGEGFVLDPPHYDCDDTYLEGVDLLGVETAEEARAALTERKQ